MIPHNRPACGPEEADAARRVLESGWLAQGREVAAFEDDMCAFVGLPAGHAVAVSSGTAALFLGLQILGARGKHIGVPVYACSALRNAVAMAGGKEELLDVAPESPNLDIESAMRRAPDMLIAPHMYGLPMDLSSCAGVPTIEDCAQCLGGSMSGVAAGLHGTVGVFSFYATKLITSGGQGGMLVSRNKDIVDQARDYREFDCRRDKKPRFNLQMTDLQAAVGREQLKKLPAFLERRESLFGIYRESGMELLDLPADSGSRAVRYRAVVRSASPRRLIDTLEKSGIRAIVPLEDWELLDDGVAYPNALHMTRTTVSLPLYPALTEKEAEKIAACLRRES